MRKNNNAWTFHLHCRRSWFFEDLNGIRTWALNYLRLDRLLLFLSLLQEGRRPQTLLFLLLLLGWLLANAHILRHGTLNMEGPNRNHKPLFMHMQMFLRTFMNIETNQRPAPSVTFLYLLFSFPHSFCTNFYAAWCVDFSRELIEKIWVMQAAYRQESSALFK